MELFAWKELLDDWNTKIVALVKRSPSEWHDIEFTQTVLNRGSIAFAPATDRDIEDLERRIGLPLPPSYKSFLQISNGWLQVGFDIHDIKISSADEADWLKPTKGFEAWLDGSGEDDPNLSPEGHAYFKNLRRTIRITNNIDDGVYLLNPNKRYPNGEFEAIVLRYSGGIGAREYASFFELMKHEKDRVIGNYADAVS